MLRPSPDNMQAVCKKNRFIPTGLCWSHVKHEFCMNSIVIIIFTLSFILKVDLTYIEDGN